MDPRIKDALTTVIDTTEPYVAALGQIGSNIVTIAVATSRLTDTIDHGFERINENFAKIQKRFDDVDRRFDEVDLRFEQIDRRFEQVDLRFEQIDRRFEQVDQRLDAMDARLDRMDGRLAVLEDDMRYVKSGIERLLGYIARDELKDEGRAPKPRTKR